MALEAARSIKSLVRARAYPTPAANGVAEASFFALTTPTNLEFGGRFEALFDFVLVRCQ